MITIEASNIYLGGGYILLEELVKTLESKRIVSKIYVGYDIVYSKLSAFGFQYIYIIKTTTLNTLFRYFVTKSNTLYFCSLPPFRKSPNSIVYSHNPHILIRPSFSISNMKYILYYYWVKYFGRNTDFFACQTDSVARKIQALGYKVRLMPFYVKTNRLDVVKQYDFCYISTVAPHKNHNRLFDAIETVIQEGYNFTIAVTIRDSQSNKHLIDKINIINNKANREVIVNKGFVSRFEVEFILNSSYTLLFPSLTETFGLPIAEALSCGLGVIASDRPYVYNLMANPVVFDPENTQSIANAIIKHLNGENKFVNQTLLVEDKIEELIGILNK